jgi:hypothetical protein
MSIEAMKQALEWAYNHGEIVFAGGGMKAVDGMNAWAQSLRQAIAEAEKKEPTYYLSHDGHLMTPSRAKFLGFPSDCMTALYTTPQPQREWVGLTDEEINKCCDFPLNAFGMKHVRKIEAKLKEKNQ